MTSTNIYRRLRELLPDAPILTGEITALGLDKDAQVTLPGGGVITVRGAAGYILGNRVYVQNAAILSTAADLPYELIEI